MRCVQQVVAVALACLAGTARGSECKPALLPAEALALVKPLLQLRVRQASDEFTAEGRWKGASPVTPEVDKRFSALLRDRSPAGDQALAYLLTVYLGEHQGEELVCEVVNRGPRMEALVRAYQQCPPLTGLEPLPKPVRGSGALPGFALDGLASGKPCGPTD